MKNLIKKSLLAGLMSVIIFIEVPARCLASEEGAQTDAVEGKNGLEMSVDADMAKALSALFILNSFGTDLAWNESTCISEIIPFYAADYITTYCVLLVTEKEPSGYIIISTDLNENLVQEFSDHAYPVYYQAETDPAVMMSNRAQKKIYYSGPLQYGYEKPDTGASSVTPYMESESEGTHYESNYDLLLSLQEVSEIFARSGGSGSYITLPYEYLIQQDANKNYHFDESFRLPFEGYEIVGWNACSVYAVAAVLHHHLKYIDGIDFDSRGSRCKAVAVENGYAKEEGGSINYHIDPGNLAPFARACIRHFNASLSVDSDMFGTWSTTKEEIENHHRPVILNILSAPSSNYVDHSVVAYGWSLWYDEDGGTYRFLLVRDGYDKTESRYVDYENVGIHYITKIY